MCSDNDVENDPSQKVDDADEEDDGEREAKWRMERLEREKFLEEHQVVTHSCTVLLLDVVADVEEHQVVTLSRV